MKYISIYDILNKKIPINSKVTITGWIRTRRDSKAGISFLSIYDGSCFDTLQIIVHNNTINYQKDILRITTGCSVKIHGILIKSIGRKQLYEIKTDKIEIIGWIDNPETYPISTKKHNLEYLRKFSHLRSRTNFFGAITRIRHTLSLAIHKFMDKNQFLWISTPIITTINTEGEGSGKMFNISVLDLQNSQINKEKKINCKKYFFNEKAFLTVSGQLNAESYACALSKIYTFGPVFRAENSNTNRHLAEFWMVEPEMAFANLDDIISLAEKMLKYLFLNILNKRIDDMLFFTNKINKNIINRLEKIINTDFIQINYTEVINILKKNKNFKEQITWGDNLSNEHEQFLTEKYFKIPVIIKNYPKNIKAFYMRINNDYQTVAAMDILFPEVGEIIGGSQREERLEQLDNNLLEKKLNKENYWWYRDLRRYGTVPHSGFGLGFERLLLYITGIKNIRDVVPFPRTVHNAKF